jgi:hypothetical protein
MSQALAQARRYWRQLLLASGSLLLGSGTVYAHDQDGLQFHGFASQGYIKSHGNNFYGDSEDGSTDYMEAGLNARWRVNSNLNLAGQIFTRDAGTTDNGNVNIDYLFADYRIIQQTNSGVGARVGRVRNNYGLYNATRDVIFTRSTILSPNAIYFEGNGLREILFSSDGLEFYSYWDEENYSSSFSLILGLDKDLSDKVKRNLLGTSSNTTGDAKLLNPIFAQYIHTLNGGDTRFGVSFLSLGMEAAFKLPIPSDLRFDARGLVLSVQRNFYDWTFTGEFASLDLSYLTTIQRTIDSRYDTYYLQSEYRITPQINAVARFESSKSTSSDTDDETTENFVLGLRWKPTLNWLFGLDAYHFNGALGIPTGDNPFGVEDKTDIIAAMIGYRF